MARPIRETPVLYGKDTIRFDEEMKRVERMDAFSREANRERARKAFHGLITEVKMSSAVSV